MMHIHVTADYTEKKITNSIYLFIIFFIHKNKYTICLLSRDLTSKPRKDVGQLSLEPAKQCTACDLTHTAPTH